MASAQVGRRRFSLLAICGYTRPGADAGPCARACRGPGLRAGCRAGPAAVRLRAAPDNRQRRRAGQPGGIRPRRQAAKANGKQPTKPLWRELKPAEQIALTPLASTWDTMNVAQKRKWLALSQNYPKLSPDEQVKLHSRMSEWAALSPQQRTQARLNFGATQQLSPDDKKAKWEAYQALSPEEKSKLAARAAKPPSHRRGRQAGAGGQAGHHPQTQVGRKTAARTRWSPPSRSPAPRCR